jgi:hypothetical protein
VSTIATAALANQEIIIDAAVKAGVKRFIPSEFGINTTNISGGIAKILATKIQIQKDRLKKAVEENEGFSWTGVSSSMFFDWSVPNYRTVQIRNATDHTIIGAQSWFPWVFTPQKDRYDLRFWE